MNGVIQSPLKKAVARQAGYSVVELMFVVGIMGVLIAIAVVQIGSSRSGLNGDGAMRVVLAQMNQAREQAITQRRNMRLTFTGGSLVDQDGLTLNGTVFVALPNDKQSARAVTIFGSTGRVRGFRWDGGSWKPV